MYGAFDIDSMPPVTITSWSPARIIESAISTARIEEAQTLLIVSEPTSFGIPAPIAACRAGAWPTPACSTSPMITYSTSSGSTPARSSAALIAIAPSSGAWYDGQAAAELPERRPDRGDDHRAHGSSVSARSHPAIARLDEAEEPVSEQSRGRHAQQERPVLGVGELRERAVEPDRLLRVVLPSGTDDEEPGEQEDGAPRRVAEHSDRGVPAAAL